jgi:hypothetical protein
MAYGFNPLQLVSSQLIQGQQNQSSTSNSTGQSTGNSAQQNTYTPGQQQVQGQLGAGYGNLLNSTQSAAGGAIPSAFTNNPNLVGAYNTSYNQTVAPQEAFQGGAGSPAIASNQALGLQQLLANQYNTGIGQYQNALGQQSSALGNAANYSLGLATGGTGQSTGTDQSQNTSTGQGTSSYNTLSPYGLLQQLGILPPP